MRNFKTLTAEHMNVLHNITRIWPVRSPVTRSTSYSLDGSIVYMEIMLLRNRKLIERRRAGKGFAKDAPLFVLTAAGRATLLGQNAPEGRVG